MKSKFIALSLITMVVALANVGTANADGMSLPVSASTISWAKSASPENFKATHLVRFSFTFGSEVATGYLLNLEQQPHPARAEQILALFNRVTQSGVVQAVGEAEAVSDGKGTISFGYESNGKAYLYLLEIMGHEGEVIEMVLDAKTKEVISQRTGIAKIETQTVDLQ